MRGLFRHLQVAGRVAFVCFGTVAWLFVGPGATAQEIPEYTFDFEDAGATPVVSGRSSGGGFGFDVGLEIPARLNVSQIFSAPSPRLEQAEGLAKSKLSENGSVQVLEPDSIMITDEKANTEYLKTLVEQLGFKASKAVPAPGGMVTMVLTYSVLKEAETIAKTVITAVGRVQVIEPNMLLISDTSENMAYVRRILGGLGFEAGEPVEQAELVTRSYACRNAPVEDLKKLADSLKSPRGSVEVFGPATLIVTDTKETIEYMSKVFDSVDRRPVLVMIEGQTYETFTDTTADYGIDLLWRAKSGDKPTPFIDLSLLALPPISESTAFQSSTLPGRFDLGGYHVGTRLGAVRGTGAGLDMGDVKIMLDFLVSQGYADIITNPKIVVANGKPAKILTGEKIPFRALKIVGGVETFITDYEHADIKLEVTPLVNEDGYITMHVATQVDTVSGFRGADQVPVITQRDADTSVTISSGSTLVIGGLRKSETREVVRKVPGLWKVPLLGKIFQAKDYETSETNLFVSITPYILDYGAGGLGVVAEGEYEYSGFGELEE
jgi:type II secretory pathway component GspD/PulD (secretin)